MFSLSPFKSVFDLQKAYPTEQSCIDVLEKVRWSEGVISPFDRTSKVYKCKDNRYRCLNTKKYFNVKTGTIYENSKIPLQVWFMASYLFVSHKRGISSYQMAKDLGITQKSAWFLLSRIRYAMEHGIFLEELGGTVEVDETFVGGKNKNRHKDKKVENSQGRSYKDKTPVLGMLQRGEYKMIERPNKVSPELVKIEKVTIKSPVVNCRVIPNTQGKTIQPILLEKVKLDTNLMTDEWMAYNGMSRYYNHNIVDHSRGQYVSDTATTNGIENVWSHLKRSIIGVYYHVSPKHLQKYANEISFRYNVKDYAISESFNLFLQTSLTRRIKYHTLTHECI